MVERDDIIDAAAGGMLHRFIADEYERGSDTNDAQFVALAIELHNARAIDLLAASTPAALGEIEGFRFFTLQQFYCQTIPSIEAEPLRLMEAVNALVAAAGNDLASNLPNGAFRDWCAVSAERVEKVLRVIEADIARAKDFLSLALEGGGRLDPAAYFAKSLSYIRENPELRLGALTGLSRIDANASLELMREALDLLGSLLAEDPDDTLRTHVLVAAIEVYVRSRDALHDQALEVVRSALAKGGDGVLNRGANALFHHRTALGDAMIGLLLTALERVNAAHKGTIDTLDIALSQLLNGDHASRAIDLVKKLLLAHPGALTLKNFDSVGRELLTNHPSARDDMIVHWLMSGDPTLADGISKLVGSVGGAPVTFDINIAPYRLSDTQAVFLARKSVGWFFFHPITAASLVICVLRTVKRDVAEMIGDLLFDPLLLNFSGELREYLEERLKGPRNKAKPQIRRALGKLEDYIGDLRSTGLIAELRPSERDRLIEQQRHNEQMRQIQKAAEEASVLMKLMPKSVILHGNGSVMYARDTSGELRRNVIKMGGYTTNWEAPRLQSIDPFGLEIMLRTFRAERLRP